MVLKGDILGMEEGGISGTKTGIEMEGMDNGAGNDTWGYVIHVNVT
jgi:hypothetical protein